MAPDDKDLLFRIARSRDAQAFSKLYDLYAPLIFGLAFRMLADRQEAEEALQDVFLQVWEKAGDYDPVKAQARTWLIVLARSRCLDRLRRRAVRAKRDPAPDGADVESARMPPSFHEPSALQTATGAELGRAVARALEELPLPQRETFEASCFEGLSHGEIAEKRGEPLGAVKTRLRLAARKLIEALGPYLK